MEKASTWLGVVMNVGVIVSLILVVYQLNRSNVAMEREYQAYQQESTVTTREGWQNFGSLIAGSSEVADIWLRGSSGEELSGIDAERFNYIAQELFYLEDQGFKNSIRFSEATDAGDWAIYQLADYVDTRPGLKNIVFALIQQRGSDDRFARRIRQLALPQFDEAFPAQ